MTDDSATLRAMELAKYIVANKQGGALGDLAHAILALLASQSSWAKEKAELKKRADGLGQLLAHVHLHLTNDENFDADELEADMRKLDSGKWIDTESILIRERNEKAELERQRDEYKAAWEQLSVAKNHASRPVTAKE